MADYPGGSDLGLEDEAGAQFSLVWGRGANGELNAEIAVKDGYDSYEEWRCVNLDTHQLLKLAATILVGVSVTGELVDRIIAGLSAPAPQAPRYEDPDLPETWGGDPDDYRYLGRQ